uniref:Tolloid protein n=1 Tax=Phallusia mammillata TaxID=59560 RepID=A0A6F9D7G9_9ASCI|nr:Tolloid protein [Phallusia mammillata]
MRLSYGVWVCFVFMFWGEFVTANTRNTRDTDEINKLITCGGGKMSMRCTEGYGVHVQTVLTRRTDKKSVQCRPEDPLSRLQKVCGGKQNCDVTIDSETVGAAIDEEGSACKDSDQCMDVGYRCLKDCEKPSMTMKGIVVVGQSYSVNSVLTIKCKRGFAPFANGEIVGELKCEENGEWSGKDVNCRDIDECQDPSKHLCDRHADCFNNVGSYTCRCGEGYEGNGYSCNPINVERQWVKQYQNDTHDLETDATCGGSIFENNGVITSPNYPLLYPRRSNCQWIVTVAPDHTIQLSILEFELEEGLPEKGCVQDYLTVYNGVEKDGANWLNTLCGNEPFRQLNSTGNQIRIEFHSDDANEKLGFKLHFKAINQFSTCQNFVGSAYEGVVILEGSRNTTVEAGSIVKLGCEEGYKLDSPNQVRICENDMRWNESYNPCSAVSCPPPPPLNTSVYLSNVDEFRYNGLPAKYQCPVGYVFGDVPGARTEIYCNKYGRWSNENDTVFPTCEKITCRITEDLYPPQHGTWSLYSTMGKNIPIDLNSTVPFDTFILYSCHKEYAMVGEPKRACVGNPTYPWSGKPIICEEDNGILGLSNFQIALIVAIISGVIVLVIGAALIYCCVRGKRRDSQQLKNRTYQYRVDRGRFDNGYTRSNVGEFVYSYPNGKHSKRSTAVIAKSYKPTNTTNSNQTLTSNYNQPYYLPSTMQPVPIPWMTSENSSLPSNGQNGLQRNPNNYSAVHGVDNQAFEFSSNSPHRNHRFSR